MKKVLASVTAAAALVVHWPALASGEVSPDDRTMFWSCDGYGVPSGRADGMTSAATLWSTIPTDNLAANSSRSRGQWGIEACTQALANPHLLSAHWRRKVNLLQARALHRLEREDAKGALADLDLAEAAIVDPADPFFARSQGISLGFLRAYALNLLGDQAGSETLALKDLALRPYSRQGPFAALVAVGPGAEARLRETLEQAVAQLQPTTIDDLYLRMAGEGRWADLVPLYNQLSTPKVRRRVGAVGSEEDREFVDLVGSNLFWIDRTGVYAYALAALGRHEEARAALKAARARLDAAAAPDPLFKPNQDSTQKEINDAAARVAQKNGLAQRGGAQLTRWSDLVELRIGVDEGRAASVAESLIKSAPQPNALGRDLVAALTARLRADPRTSSDILKAIAALPVPPPAPKTRKGDDLRRLIEALPIPEVPERMPRYRKAAPGNLFHPSEEGFSVAPAIAEFTDIYGPGVIEVEFRSLDTNGQVAEEMALLRAADLALQAGRSGIVVLARRDVQHRSTQVYKGVLGDSIPRGFSTSLTVVFVDKASPPGRLQGAEWRIIDARAVYDALSPIYLRAGPGKKNKGT